jgi:4-amino-4-deoxy-L-arabinose transferase-like glycosyltransferase
VVARHGAGVAVVVTVLLAVLLLAPGLGQAPFDDPGEGQHAEIAREMLGGSWIALRLNGVRYFDKPPLLYWLTATSFTRFGIDEWAARLPSLLGALVAVAGTALLGARLLGTAGGLLAGAALLSCALFAAFARYVRPETLFVAAIQWGFTGLLLGAWPARQSSAAAGSPPGGGVRGPLDGSPASAGSPPGGGVRGPLDGSPASAGSPPGGGVRGPFLGPRIRQSRGSECPPAAGSPGGSAWAIVGCVALGVAALAKDPLGMLGPLAAVAMAMVLVGRLRPIRAWMPALGAALLLVVGLAWYAVAAATEPSFLWYTVVDNHLLNVARMRIYPDEDVPLSALEFLAAAGFGAFPWILAAAAAVARLVRSRAWREPAELPWVALALWAVGVLALFTLSPFKLPHYGLPAYPAIALLAARGWRDATARPRALVTLHLVLFALLGAVFAWAAASDGQDFTASVFGISDVYSRKEAAIGQASPYPPWSIMQPMLVQAAAVMAAGVAGLAWARARRSAPAGAAVVALAMLLLVPLVNRSLAATSSARTVAPMAAEIRARLASDDVLILEGPIENAAALELYSGHRPILLDGTRSVLGIGATFPDASASFWTAETFRAAWASARPPYLLTGREAGRSIVASLPPGSVRLLLAHNGRWLYRRAGE